MSKHATARDGSSSMAIERAVGQSEVLASDKQRMSGSRTAEPRGLSERTVKELAQRFKLLADETRLKVLFILQQQDEVNVLELCRQLRQRQPAVSHHLALLRAAGLLEMRREGKHNFYRLLPERFEDLLGSLVQSPAGQPLQLRSEGRETRYARIKRESG